PLEDVAEDGELLVGLRTCRVGRRTWRSIDEAHGRSTHQGTREQKRQFTYHFLSFQSDGPPTTGPDRRVSHPCGTQRRVPACHFQGALPRRSPPWLHPSSRSVRLPERTDPTRR